MILLDIGEYPRRGDRDLTRIFGVLWRLRQGVDGKPWRPELATYQHALQIYQGPPEPTRAVLDAHILARRSPDDAAKAIGVPPAVARNYATVFFDVAGRLGQAGFVAGNVFQLRHGPQPTLGYVLRAFAWSGGPLIVDDILHAFGLGHYALGPEVATSKSAPHDLSRRSAIALLLLSAAPCRKLLALELDLRYAKLEALEHDQERHQAALLKLSKAVIKRVRRAFGVAARDNPFLAALFAV